LRVVRTGRKGGGWLLPLDLFRPLTSLRHLSPLRPFYIVRQSKVILCKNRHRFLRGGLRIVSRHGSAGWGVDQPGRRRGFQPLLSANKIGAGFSPSGNPEPDHQRAKPPIRPVAGAETTGPASTQSPHSLSGERKKRLHWLQQTPAAILTLPGRCKRPRGRGCDLRTQNPQLQKP
jgi:hypothetical protein